MRIEQLKRWHWALVGLCMGFVVAWAWGNVRDSGGFGDPKTVGADAFERLLKEGPLQGHPRVKGITIHQDDGRFWVSMKVLEPDPKDPHPKNPRRYRYVSEQLNATTPYMADFRDAPTQTVSVRVNPSAVSKAHGLGKHADEGALALWVNGAAARVDEIAARLHLQGWTIKSGEWADPGAGAQVGIVLRPAEYQLMVVLSSKQEKPPTLSDLTVKMNGHRLALTGPTAVISGTAFKGIVPREFLVAGDRQVLEFSRQANPVKIWEVRLIDPTYSVADYLNYLKGSRPDLGFATAWWETAWARCAVCGGGGAILFALLAPLSVLLFTGAKRADSSGDPAYDLDRFKGEATNKPSESRLEDELDLAAMEAKLAEGSEPRVAGAAGRPAAPSPAAPIELSSDPVVRAAQTDKEREDYKGEFYPVARHPSHRDHNQGSAQ